jgi:hypothetical protein
MQALVYLGPDRKALEERATSRPFKRPLMPS